MREFITTIAGTSFDNPGGRSRQALLSALGPGDSLRLVREQGNPHDPRAVLCCALGGQILGYIPAAVAEGLSADMDGGSFASAEVVAVRGGTAGKPSLGCAIRVRIEGG